MRYLNRFNENMNMAKSIVSKKMEAFDKLKNLLAKNLGYIGKFTQFLMEENVLYKDLEELYTKLINLKSKNINIDINTFTYEKLVDKIQHSENDLNVNSIISEFPSQQKSLIKEIFKSYNKDKVYNALLKISKKENSSTFISKISRYKTSEQIMNAAVIFSKDGKNDIESVKKYIESSQTADIIVEKDNILIVKISNIEDVKVLGSDTSWCILNSSSWSSYTKDRVQFILFDYSLDDVDPKFKIGFTVNKDGSLYAAHDVLDSNSKDYLAKILAANSITLNELVSKEKIDISNITLNYRTSITAWKEVVNAVENNKAEELLIKFFDINKIGYNNVSKTITKNKDITDGQSGIIVKLLLKICKNKLGIDHIDKTKYIIKEEDIVDLDPRIKYYLKSNYFIIPSSYIPYGFNEQDIVNNFDSFSINAFIGFVSGIPDEIIYTGGYSKDGRLKFSDNLLRKIYDRVTDSLYVPDNKKDNFNKGYAFLGKLLNKPNHKEYEKYLNYDDVANHNNFFKEKIDLSKLKTLYGIRKGNFDWTTYIIKKDYPNLYMSTGDAETLNDIFNTLGDYNINITINNTLTQLNNKIREKHNKITNKLLTSLPTRSSKKEFTSEDGKHKIILK